MKTWIRSFFSLFFPRHCVVCSCLLIRTEECICARCHIAMPQTRFHLQKDNLMEKQFWALMPIERATAYFYYQKESRFRHIIHDLKYKGHKQIGEVMGRYMATEIQDSRFFDGIDLIMPVPLHKKKLKKRGYNQSEWLARGLEQVTTIPLNTKALVRKSNTNTQTSKSRFNRWVNMENVFELRHPEEFAGKHILLVDDVLTTGATIVSCSLAFSGVKDVRFSVITLGISR